MQYFIDKLTANFTDFFQKTGAQKAIIGVSGGVDSACVLALAVRALGREKVFALLMPHSDFSSRENLADARALTKSLDVKYEEIDIKPLSEPFFTLSLARDDFPRANIMSRIRMVLLYAAANAKNGIVLGTSNKTEILIGFFTKYGDGGVDVEVIGELWKTQVFALAKALGLPESFVTKKPSAELFFDHYDEVEIGVEYRQIDQILQKIEQNKDFFPQTDAEKRVFGLYQKSAHKRVLPPIISAKD